jgi:ribonuclease Z
MTFRRRFAALVVAAAAASGSIGSRFAAQEAATSVVLLGTGTPVPNPDAFGPATAIVRGNQTFLVDAGAGVTRRMRAANLSMTGVTALFVTHLHSDHTLGYPDLIFTTWLMRRSSSFDVYGPRGLQRMTNHLIAAWAEDLDVRINGLEHEQPTYRVAVHETRPGTVRESGGVRVTAFAVEHGSWKHAFGYRFDAPDRSVVISGDTRPSESLVAAAKGCDVLVHEVYASADVAPEDRPGGESWPEYMKAAHTSDVELGAIAARVQPKLLVLHHVIRPYASDDALIAAIRTGGYTGRIVIGRDLDRF